MFLSRRGRRTGALLAGAAGALLLLAGPASAHVTVHSDNPTVGAGDSVLAFRVPNEMDNATTTKLEVQFPTDHPLLGVLVADHPGWTSRVQTVKLNPPVTTDDGPVTEATSLVTWTADGPSDGIAVGSYADFDVAVGSLPGGVTSLQFKALQTYSNGQIVRWIDVAAAGQAEPEHPAPTLQLTKGGTDSAPSGADTASPTPAPPASAASSSGSDSDGTARGLGIAGIVVGALGLIAGAVGLTAARRRTPTSEA